MVFKIANMEPVTKWDDINTNKYHYEINNKFVKWLLDKLIKHNLITKKEYIDKKRSVNYEEVQVNTRDLRDLIIENMNKIRFYNCENIEKILIGTRYLDRMGIQTTQNIFMNHYEPGDYLQSFCGTPIVLCPFIDGIVFVPKERC